MQHTLTRTHTHTLKHKSPEPERDRETVPSGLPVLPVGRVRPGERRLVEGRR